MPLQALNPKICVNKSSNSEKESKNETMETLSERNQNSAKRQLYYIFVLIAGLIAILFLLFIVKKITKRFRYRSSSICSWLLSYESHHMTDMSHVIELNQWATNSRIRSTEFYLSRYFFNDFTRDCNYGLGYNIYDSQIMSHRLLLNVHDSFIMSYRSISSLSKIVNRKRKIII